ncbi:response regulator [Idiomarina xiamenensis]|uniref:Chemotaxis protein CheY n=1 Tax=Idiomarina xiamenensis 10-D-4 TaxID=740709 RepID=K2K8D3_9GAMM|nr:response regulator [Idiomarina xiamenensis]EKE82847.1 chemotaxis protein CheY [Idiomarina xiamenensis 10-D-4]
MTLSLLLVEDNQRTQAQLQDMLAHSGFHVTVANDGLDGFSKAKQQHFDIVLSDHKMPLMDGITLLRNLRDLPTYQQQPLLLMTTQNLTDIEPLALKAGAVQCLAKPLAQVQLLDVLRQWAKQIAA